MAISSDNPRVHHSLLDRDRKLTLIGLQAVLIGRALEDRQALLSPDVAARLAISPQERAFFDVKARFGSALERIGRATQPDGRARLTSSPPLAMAVASRLQIIGPDDPGADEVIDLGPAEGTNTDTEVVAATESDLEFRQYAPEVQQAAQDVFNASAAPMLTEQQQNMFDQISGYAAAGGKAGGAPHVPGAGFAGGFINDRGDLDIDKVNEVLTGVVVGAAVGIGGIVGAALAAFALVVVPRMLAAFEDAIGDLLVGTLPGQ